LSFWYLSLFDQSSFGFNLSATIYFTILLKDAAEGDTTRVNSFSILAGSVACPNDDKPQPIGAEHEARRKFFVKIADCLIISRFRIEDYMSTFPIASTSLPPIYVGVYLLSRYL
jgi:hypothetical protein